MKRSAPGVVKTFHINTASARFVGISSSRSVSKMGLLFGIGFVPRAVFLVVVGDAFDFPFAQAFRYGTNFLRRHPRPQRSWSQFFSLRHDRTGRNDATLTNHTIIHHDRAHADEHIIRYGTTVHNRIVTNAYIVAYGRGELLIGAMDRGVVLHIHFISKGDAVDVAADDASKPETASVATFKLANDGCIIRYKTIGAEFGRMSKQGLDKGHGYVV